MLRFYADKFISINQMMQLLENFVEFKGEFDLGKESLKDLMQDLTKLHKILLSIDLKFSAVIVDRIKHKLKGNSKADKLLQQLINVLNTRIIDELKTRLVFAIPSGKAGFYNPNKPIFGKEIADKFNDMNEDISEAGNCFAVGRYTACAFHLMRVMERAVQKLGNNLGVPLVNETEWYKILTAVKSEINKMPKGSQKITYSAIHDRLDSVRIAWRNETMHPKATYTDEEAEALLGAVKMFMKELLKVL